MQTTEQPETKVALTNREYQILILLTDGPTNKEIASKLHVSVETVKEHVHNLLKKTGCSGRTQLAARAAICLDRIAQKGFPGIPTSARIEVAKDAVLADIQSWVSPIDLWVEAWIAT